MSTVHHLENSRSHRILWLLEELGVEYEIKQYQRDPETKLAPQSLKDIHPLGKAPVISDDDIVVAESGAITEYLMSKYSDGKLGPGDDPATQRAYSYYMHYAEGTVMPLMIVGLLMSRIESAKLPFFIKPIAKGITGKVRENYLNPNLSSNLAFMESTLSQSKWFTGDSLTAADIQMSFIAEGLNVNLDLDNDFPNLARFLKQCRDSEGYQRAEARGGALTLGFSD